MADILLSVGVQTGTADVSKFREGINSLVTEINRDPPKVEVGVEVSAKALNNFRTQLSKIVNGLTLSNGTQLSLKIDGVGEINTQAESAAKAIKKVSDAAKEASVATKKMGTDAETAEKKQEAAAKKAIKAAREKVTVLKQANSLLAKMQNAEVNWTKAATGSSQASYNKIKDNILVMQNLIDDFNSGKISVDEFRNSTTNLSGEFDVLSSNIKGAGENTQTLGAHFGKLATKFTQWFGVSQMIMFAVESVKQMVKGVIDLDTAMTELRKVTDETEATYNKFLNTAVSRAKIVGATLSDVVTATADFARLGYNVSEASNIADAALIYKNVGDGIESITQASESIISTMQAFGIETANVMSIVDKFNAVGNNFAISSTGIGEALQKSAAAMNAAGNTLDETIALITAANTIVQNPDSVGTTLKTVSMFLRAAKTEAENAGESTEGMANSVSELRQEILALTGERVDIQIDDDTFKSTYQILKELSQVWGDLTDVSQANILELIGGKRNSNVVSALMENFKIAEDALKTSVSAAGSAIAENEKYLDSIEGKIAQFQASWQALSATIINGNLVKGVVDFGRGFVEAINWVIESVGSLGFSLAAIPTFLAALKIEPVKKKFELLYTTINNFAGAFKSVFTDSKSALVINGLASAMTGLSSSQQVAFITTNKLNIAQAATALQMAGVTREERKRILAEAGLLKSTSAQIAANGGLTVSLKSITASLIAQAKAWAMTPFGMATIAVAGIYAVAKAFDYLASANERAIDKHQELSSTFEETQSELESLDAELTTSKERLEELSAIDSPTYVEQGEIEKLETSIPLLEKELELLRQRAEYESKKVSDAANDALTARSLYMTGNSIITDAGVPVPEFGYRDIIEEATAYQAELDNIERSLSDAYDRLAELEPGTAAYEAQEGQIDYLKQRRDELGQSVNDLETQILELYKDLLNPDGTVKSGYEGTAGRVQLLLGIEVDESAIENAKATAGKTTEEIKKEIENVLIPLVPKDYEQYAEGTGAHFRTLEAYTNKVQEYKDLLGSLSDDELDYVYDLVIKQGVTSWEDITAAVVKYRQEAAHTFEEIKTSAAEATETTQNLLTGISGVQDMLESQSTGVSISIDDFNTAALNGYSEALEYNNGTLQLNAEKVNELIKAKAEEQIAHNDTQKALAQSEYLENAAEIKRLRAELSGLGTDEEGLRAEINANIDSLLAENSSLRTICSQYDVMSASLREATSAYQHWLNAQSASQTGDMFDSALSAIQHINDTLNNTESDLYGRIGRTDYKAAVDFIIPESVDSEDTTAVNSYLNSISEMFTYDENGNRTGLNIANFCQQAVDEGLMVLNEAGTAYEIAGGKTMEDFANGLNLAMPLVQAMFGELQEFGAEFDWADEANKTFGDIAVSAHEAAEALRELDGTENLKLNLDVSDIETADGKVAALKATIAEMTAYRSTVPIDSSEAEYANQVIEYCVLQKQLLEAPAVMMVDTSLVEGKIGELVSLFQEFVQLKNEIERQAALNIDTADAEAELDAVVGKIASYDPTILANVGISDTSEDAINAFINSIDSPEALVNFGVNEDAIIGYTPDDKDSNVILHVDDKEVDEYVPEDKEGWVYYYYNASALNDFDPPNLTRYVIYKPLGTGGLFSADGTAHVSGTANASGTARTNGDWGTAPGGPTLVGELGREIVVDPRTGKWYTVGDRGAEFVNIPPGAIVFNHLQSESLLEHGYVTGRGTAMVSGTAKSSGRALVTGFIPITNATTGKHLNQTNSGWSTPSSSSSNSNSYSDYSSNDVSTATRVVEEYIADIDKYILLLKKLEKVQQERSSLEKEIEASTDLSEKIFMSGNLSKLYLEEAAAEQALMDAKRRDIAGNVAELQKLGFDVEYDSGSNKLLIKNLEHLNEITATTTGKYDNLMEATNDLRKEIEDLIDETEDLNYDNIDHAENIEDLSYDILELKNNIIDYIEEIYDAQVDAYKKIVDERKSLLSSAKDELDYEEKISEKVEEIAQLQADIDRLSLDDSRNAQAERNALLQELYDKQKELADLQSDNAYAEQTAALDKMAEDYAAEKESEIEILRSTVETSDEMWSSFYQMLIGQTADVGNAINEEIANAWLAAAGAVKQYSESVGNITGGGAMVISDVPVYHTGGYVDKTNINEDETFAILQKDELVLTEHEQKAAYRIIESYSELLRCLGIQVGSKINEFAFGDMSSNAKVFPRLSSGVSDQIVERSQQFVFEPHIDVSIQHNGSLTDGDAERYGNKIATTTLDTLYDAFERRGVISTRNSRLKPA